MIKKAKTIKTLLLHYHFMSMKTPFLLVLLATFVIPTSLTLARSSTRTVVRTFNEGKRTTTGAWPEILCSRKPCPVQVVCQGSLSHLDSWSCRYPSSTSSHVSFKVSLEWQTSDLCAKNLMVWVDNNSPWYLRWIYDIIYIINILCS